MSPQALRIHGSLGAGIDGASFAASDSAGLSCVLIRLMGDVVADSVRRRRLERSVALHEVGSGGPLLRVLGAHLDARPALLVVEHPRRSLVDLPPWRSIDDARRGLRVLLDVASALQSLHAEGLAHGRLRRAVVRVRDDDSAAICALGVSAGGVPREAADVWLVDAARAADDNSAGSDADIFAFGGLCAMAALGAEEANARWSNAPAQASTLRSAAIAAVLALSDELRRVDPAARPSMDAATERLRAIARDVTPGASIEGASTVSGAPVPPAPAAPTQRSPLSSSSSPSSSAPAERSRRLGRFRLDALLGAGAMGRVYRGTDVDSGAAVAVKLLARNGPLTPKAMQRFRKEARVLGALSTPGVARLLAHGADGGTLYLVTELVDGETLMARLRSVGFLVEKEAVDIVIDVLRALDDVHRNGVVHRDLKSDNIMLASAPGQPVRTRVIDFGIARHLEEEGSLAMTHEGAVLGTPLYMAPEQARGGVVDARADLYAIGNVLFELVVGRPPFAGNAVSTVLSFQMEKIPPRANTLRAEVSDELSSVIARALEKDPAKRFADARAFIDALLPLSSTPPPARHSVVEPGLLRWVFDWRLRSSPRELWPLVSNTDRINRAIGFAAARGELAVEDGLVVERGTAVQSGFRLAWREHPYEWVQGRRLGIVREYTEGPMRLLRTTVELEPEGEGTRLKHTVEVLPRNLLSRAVVAADVTLRSRPALEQVYLRIDDLLQGKLADHDDAFEPVPALAGAREARLAAIEPTLVAAGASAAAVARLGDWLRQAAPQELARLRPLAFARRYGLAGDDVVTACLHAAHKGLLELRWDILCPSCRTPSSIAETLQALRDHGRCEVCDVAWAQDLTTSIELVFRAHPSLRDIDDATYCLASPAHAPHVLAQVRVLAGATAVLDVTLAPGSYALKGRRLPWSRPFRVRDDAPLSTWRVSLERGPDDAQGHTIAAGPQRFEFVNDTGREQLVRVEQATTRDDVLTGAMALASPLFRRLFPHEVPAPGALLHIGDVSLLVVERRPVTAAERSLEQRFGDYRALDAAIADAGGVVVKLDADGVLASFGAASAAVRCALRLPLALKARGVDVAVACAAHRGACGAVAIADRLDYFGGAVDHARELVTAAADHELVVSDEVRADVAFADDRFRAASGDAIAGTLVAGDDDNDDSGSVDGTATLAREPQERVVEADVVAGRLPWRRLVHRVPLERASG